MKVAIKVLNTNFYKERSLPEYATPGSAGIDLMCTEDVCLEAGDIRMLPTGLSIYIASHYKLASIVIDAEVTRRLGITGLIIPRSSLGLAGLELANTIGVIDEDYQGELLIAAHNRNSVVEWQVGPGGRPLLESNKLGGAIRLRAGERIAQLLFVPTIRVELEPCEEFTKITPRGKGGFGSTGRWGN
jgi:dUTP pyrophosphatase